jgi:hypothetical protein
MGLGVLAFLGVGAARLGAQDMAVPVETQVPILAKVLEFNRKLAGHREGELVIGILHQRRYRTSVNVADEVQRAVSRLPVGVVQGRHIRTVAIALEDQADLESVLAREQIDVLYVAPLRAVDLDALKATCRASQVITVTGVPEYVERGLAIGVGVKGERPEIVINLDASRAEGAELNAQVLRIARIVP